MRHFLKNIMVIVFTALGFSCADETLDPLQFEKVKKGTLLALRGDQLDAIYWNGEAYGSAFFYNKILGNETFDFDAEFLSEDPNSLESFDIYVFKRTWSDDAEKHVEERLLLTNVPFSSFQTTDDYRGPWVSVSIALDDILTKIGASTASQAGLDTLYSAYAAGIELEGDLNLTSGEKVLAVDLVAAGLYESDQFYPAQKLIYGVEDIEDARPVATTSLRGQYSKSTSGVVTRPVIPLKSGAKDTVNIKFDQAISGVPTISVSPSNAGTVGALVAKAGTNNEFYVPFVAGATYTGAVLFTISGATSGETGALAGLEQVEATAAIAVDNLAPQNTSFTTGTRVGKGQSATITLKFNEALGTAPTISIDPGTTGVDVVTNAKPTLSADGLTATYVYEYKDLDGDATHGNATISVTGGKDKANNELPAIASKPLTIDIGPAPAPIAVLDANYDWGTQIKWTLNYVTGPSNVGGSTSGTVYYVAVESGADAPTSFVGGDVPSFIMAESTETEDNSAKQAGIVVVTSGTSGTVYSAFTPNGTLDVYTIFVSSSGVISAISAPTTVIMN
jgi:hypothetical protein